MADQDGALLAEGADQRGDVTDQVQQGVRVDRLGLLAAGVAALVDGDHAVAGLGERGELVPPGVPALREAVQQQDQWPLPLFGDVQPDSVHLDLTVRDTSVRLLGHAALLVDDASPGRTGGGRPFVPRRRPSGTSAAALSVPRPGQSPLSRRVRPPPSRRSSSAVAAASRAPTAIRTK